MLGRLAALDYLIGVLYNMVEKKSTARFRNFATVVYPESAPDGWLDIVSDEHIPVFVSPLHQPDDKDKKPHYHVLAMYEGKKSNDQVADFFKRFGGVGLLVVQSIRGYARYLCHLDEVDKPKYDVNEVISFAGADYINVIGLPVDRQKAIKEMQDFCNAYDLVSFSLLCDYAAAKRPDWHRILTESCSYYMSKWMSSRKWSRENGFLHIVDKETGDIIF